MYAKKKTFPQGETSNGMKSNMDANRTGPCSMVVVAGSPLRRNFFYNIQVIFRISCNYLGFTECDNVFHTRVPFLSHFHLRVSANTVLAHIYEYSGILRGNIGEKGKNKKKKKYIIYVGT